MSDLSRRNFISRFGRETLERVPAIASFLKQGKATDNSSEDSGPSWVSVGPLALFPPQEKAFDIPTCANAEPAETLRVWSDERGIAVEDSRGQRLAVRLARNGVLEACLSEPWPNNASLSPMTGEMVFEASSEIRREVLNRASEEQSNE